MTRTTTKTLDSLIRTLNSVTGQPDEPYRQLPNGKWESNAGHYCLSRCYGGYELQQMCEGGGVRCPVEGGHRPPREVAMMIRGMLAGIRAAQTAAAD